jgi:hypothetical protein
MFFPEDFIICTSFHNFDGAHNSQASITSLLSEWHNKEKSDMIIYYQVNQSGTHKLLYIT